MSGSSSFGGGGNRFGGGSGDGPGFGQNRSNFGAGSRFPPGGAGSRFPPGGGNRFESGGGNHFESRSGNRFESAGGNRFESGGGGNRFDGGGNRFDRQAGGGGNCGGSGGFDRQAGGGGGSFGGRFGGGGGGGNFGSGSGGGNFNCTPTRGDDSGVSSRGFPNFRGRSVQSSVNKPMLVFDDNDNFLAEKEKFGNANRTDFPVADTGSEFKTVEDAAINANNKNSSDLPTDIGQPKHVIKTFTENWRETAVAPVDQPRLTETNVAKDSADEPKKSENVFAEETATAMPSAMIDEISQKADPTPLQPPSTDSVWDKKTTQPAAPTTMFNGVPAKPDADHLDDDSALSFADVFVPKIDAAQPKVNIMQKRVATIPKIAVVPPKVDAIAPPSINQSTKKFDWTALAKVTAAFRVAFAELDDFVQTQKNTVA